MAPMIGTITDGACSWIVKLMMSVIQTSLESGLGHLYPRE